MKTRLELIGRITCLFPQGRLDFNAATHFQTEVEQAVGAVGPAPAGVIIDCEGLDYVSSAGLRVFLVAARAAKRAGIAFAVCSLRPAVREVFDVSGFDQLMGVHHDRALAIAQMPP